MGLITRTVVWWGSSSFAEEREKISGMFETRFQVRVLSCLLLALSACGGDSSPATPTTPTSSTPTTPTASERPNIIVAIGDDIGLDASICHNVSVDRGRAPRLASLCASGVVFDNVWAAPLCSPTRASMLTGRHGFRTTVGTVNRPLPLTERGLPKALLEGNPAYATAAIGKWHLANASNGGNNHPSLFGFPYYSGSLGGQVENYLDWTHVTNGVAAKDTNYVTTVQASEARDWIATQTKPWMLWLAFNAGHTPYHIPPAGLTTYTGLTLPIPPRPVNHYHAAMEAMDNEFGRLLDSLSPAARAKTWIIYLIGDNGTPSDVAQVPVTAGHAKGSLYQGGIAVPMMISGPGVVSPGRRVGALVHTVDIFTTVLELAQVEMAKALPAGGNTVDSVSLVPYLKNPAQAPLRPWVMTEVFGDDTANAKQGKAIRDTEFKLIRFDDSTTELYDLRIDPWENTNLMAGSLSSEARTHLTSLTAALDTLLASR